MHSVRNSDTTPTANELLNPSMNIHSRMSFDTSMMLSALSISQMATCSRRSIGCVLVKDRHIVATGYNGSPKGLPHCLDIGCMMYEGHCIATVHAEANACLRCIEADTAYCTDRPCLTCLRLMLQKGVKRILYWRHYTDGATDEFLIHNFGEPVDSDWSNWPLSRVGLELSDLLSKTDSELKGLTL